LVSWGRKSWCPYRDKLGHQIWCPGDTNSFYSAYSRENDAERAEILMRAEHVAAANVPAMDENVIQKQQNIEEVQINCEREVKYNEQNNQALKQHNVNNSFKGFVHILNSHRKQPCLVKRIRSTKNY